MTRGGGGVSALAALLAACVVLGGAAGCRRGAGERRAAAGRATPGRAPAPRPAAPERADAIVFRFQDHLAAAEITGPDPARALVTVGARTRALVNPYGRAPGRRAYYLAELAFTAGRVADYATAAQWPGDGPADRGTKGATGLIGGGSGVTTLRAGLLAPPDTTFTWKVKVPDRAYLAFEVGVAPGRTGAPVATTVTVDGTEVWTRSTAFAEAGRWVPAEVDLGAFAGRTVAVTLAARALRQGNGQPAIGPALFADPLLLQRGAFAGPQIVVLALDAVRADVVGANGSDFGVTPNLDRLAAEGTSFSQAIIPWTWTRPSVIGMLAGCFPQQLRAPPSWEVTQEWREQFYRGRPPLVTRDLYRAGYQTATIGTAVLFVGYHPLGLDLGWGRADDVRDLEEETAGTARGVLAFLKANRTRPFFLYVHLDTAHLPYNPPARLRELVDRSPAARRYPAGNARNYLAEVAFADEQVGRVRAALERLGMAGRTLLVVTADHGENIDQDKYIVYPATGRNTIWGHGSTPYDNVLRVPLVFWQPGRVPAGRRVDAQVRTMDLAPTLDELAGLPSDPRHCGRSMVNLMRGETEPTPRVSLSYSFYSTIVRDGEWKLIQWHGEAAATRLLRGTTPVEKMQELYHVSVDPRELDELSAKRPAELRRMRALFAAASREARKPVPPPNAAPGAAPAPPPLVAAAGIGPESAPATAPAGTVAAASAPAGAAVAVLHLRFGADAGRRHLEARLRSSKALAVRAATGWVKIRGEPGGLVVEAEAAPRAVAPEVAVEVDLDATVELSARVDGHEVPADRLWAGPFALALLEGQQARIDRAVWPALRARGAPRSVGGGVYVWGEGDAAPGAPAPGGDDSAPVVTPVHAGDVAKILKGWGYIQGGDKSTDKPK